MCIYNGTSCELASLYTLIHPIILLCICMAKEKQAKYSGTEPRRTAQMAESLHPLKLPIGKDQKVVGMNGCNASVLQFLKIGQLLCTTYNTSKGLRTYRYQEFVNYLYPPINNPPPFLKAFFLSRTH